MRGGTYRGTFSKAKAVATIHKRQAMLKKKHVQASLCRSDNATCLPGKKDCVKVAKEKKQVEDQFESVH